MSSTILSPGAKLRAAISTEKPLQVVGAINAYAARMAEATGFRALYLSGGGVAANSLGLPDLGISTMDDVLIDIRRITEASSLPLLVDADTGWGGAFNIARTVRSFIKAGAAGFHIEDQVQSKRCGHRPGKEVVSKEEMVDRIKACVDARTDRDFVIMARSDALASHGLDEMLDRLVACVDAGADAAVYARGTGFRGRGHRAALLFGLSRDERGRARGVSGHPPGRHAEERGRRHADA
jgi:methylisocitrate lyase